MKLTRVAFLTALTGGLNAVVSTTLGVMLMLRMDTQHAGHLYLNLAGSWIASFCSFGFFVVFYRETSGRSSPISLRHAGLIAAILYALIVFLVYSPALLRIPSAWLYVLPTIVWGCFFWVFYMLPEPLDSPLTRALAALLALLSVYIVYRNVTALSSVMQKSPHPFQALASQLIGTSLSIIYYVFLIALLVMIAARQPARLEPVKSL